VKQEQGEQIHHPEMFSYRFAVDVPRLHGNVMAMVNGAQCNDHVVEGHIYIPKLLGFQVQRFQVQRFRTGKSGQSFDGFQGGMSKAAVPD
jgi:hypothetical protein